MNLDTFRTRLQYKGDFVPTLEVLTALQKQFLLQVPFENLDIHLDVPMDLTVPALYHKIVERKRGGLCFENNTLFHALLTQIGFKVAFVRAEMYQNKPFTGITNHMALRVDLNEETYLVDVGNGRFYGSPIPLHSGAEVQGEDTLYWIENFENNTTLMYRDSKGENQPRYAFHLEAMPLEAFIEPSIYTQKAPESIFRQKLLVTLYQKEGRVTLSDMKLLTTKNGIQESKALTSPDDYRALLDGVFGIQLEAFQMDYLIHKMRLKSEQHQD
jgi:N-hydroxyarylamine O-acetyltransferase